MCICEWRRVSLSIQPSARSWAWAEFPSGRKHCSGFKSFHLLRANETKTQNLARLNNGIVGKGETGFSSQSRGMDPCDVQILFFTFLELWAALSCLGCCPACQKLFSSAVICDTEWGGYIPKNIIFRGLNPFLKIIPTSLKAITHFRGYQCDSSATGGDTRWSQARLLQFSALPKEWSWLILPGCDPPLMEIHGILSAAFLTHVLTVTFSSKPSFVNLHELLVPCG